MSRKFLTPVELTEIIFDVNASAVLSERSAIWDNGEGTLALGLKGGNVKLNIGQENVVLCYNGTGSTLNDGQVVYITGAQGQRPSLALAQANAESTSSKALGIVTEPILNGAEGFVTTFGIVNNVDTSSFLEGDALWLSPTTPGGLTKTKPSSPNHMVFIGYAIKSNAASGRIFVNPQNGYELDELHNVTISSIQDKDYILYDSATNQWINDRTYLLNSSSASQTKAGNLTISGVATAETLDLNEAHMTAKLNTISVTTPVQIDSFNASNYRGAEYIFQFSQNSVNFAITKVMLIHNGTDVAVSEYGNVEIGTTIPYEFNGAFSLGNLEITVTCSTANINPVDIKFTRTLFDN